MQLKQWTLKSQITCDIMIFHQPLSLGLADIKLEIRCQVKRDQKEKKKKKSTAHRDQLQQTRKTRTHSDKAGTLTRREPWFQKAALPPSWHPEHCNQRVQNPGETTHNAQGWRNQHPPTLISHRVIPMGFLVWACTFSNILHFPKKFVYAITFCSREQCGWCSTPSTWVWVRCPITFFLPGDL